MELKFLKRRFPRTKNTTAGERYSSGPQREQPFTGTMEKWRIEIHQLQRTFEIQMVPCNQSTSLPEED